MRPYGLQVHLIIASLALCASSLVHGQTASLSPTSMSFGNQAVGTTSTAKTVKLTNTSATALLINSITPSKAFPPFTVSNNCPGSLTQNAFCTITATFSPSATGAASETITISDNATSGSTQVINVSGTGVGQATVSATTLSFGNVVVGSNKTATVTVTNNLPTALSLNSVTATGAYTVNNSVTGACGASIAAGGHCSIGVTFTASTPLGTSTGTLTINDSAAAPYNSLKVSLTGASIAQATVSPASVSFGNVGLGVASTISVTLTNNLTTAISISSPSVTGVFTINSNVTNSCGSSLAGGAHCSVGVTFTPTQLGAQTGTLTISTSAGNGSQNVPVIGTGTTSSILSVTVAPATPSILLKATQQFSATANFPGAIALNVTSSATWSSSATRVATITSQGLATGAGPGAATIKATYAGKSASTTLSVVLPVTPVISWATPAAIVYGTPLSSTQLDAVATFNGVPVPGAYSYLPIAGTVLPVGSTTLSVIFTPTDTLHYTNAQGYVAQLVNREPVTLIFSNTTVPYNGLAQSPTVTTNVGNLPYIITFNGSIAAPINVGTYNVTATVNFQEEFFGSGSTVFTILQTMPNFSNITSQSTWSGTASTNLGGAIAAGGAAVPAGETVTISINGSQTTAIVGANGAFSAPVNTAALTVASSPYVVTYSYGGDSNLLPTSDSSTSLTVNQTPASIALTPANPAIPLYSTQQFAANATYADSSTKDVTSLVTWSFAANSPPSAGAVASLIGGLATADNTRCGGPVTVTATAGTVSASTGLMVSIPGGFACGANTVDARDPHTATLLNNGLILIAGGFGSNGTALNTAELYDPVANSSRYTVGSMNTPRAGHTATLLGDGTVLIVGGVDDQGNLLATAEIYDPVADSFTLVSSSSLSVARQKHSATLLNDGTVVIVGGAGAGGGVLAIDVYDPSIPGFWTTSINNLAVARDSHTATLLSTGDVLIAGGYSGGAAVNSAEIVSASCHCNSSNTTIPMTSARAQHSATALGNGQVLLAGGIDDTGGTINSAELYDPSGGAFNPISASMACSRASHTATLLAGGKVLLAGGCSDPANTAELFDPTSSAFTATPSQLNTPRSAHTATLIQCSSCAENGWVLVEDGVDSGGNQLNTTEWYQPIP